MPSPTAPKSRAPLACLVLLGTLLLGAGAGPGPSAAVAACVPTPVEGLGPACRTADGLWEVVLEDGTTLTTHGVDPHAHDHGTGMGPGDPERAPACATDFHQHVLYGRPASAPDRFAAVKAQIQSAIRRMDHVLNEEALSSGGVTADYKVLCDAAGDVRVDAFVVSSGSAEFSAVVSAARAAGFNRPNADYTIFYDGTSSGVCGVGSFSTDDRPGADNRNNNGGGYGITYVNCWSGRTPMHENGHNQGAVQTLAPDTDAGGHCIEGHDVMCYPTSAYLVLCPDRIHFDCDNDTYFDAAPEPGEWLATHWNIGSRVNRFVRFGDQGPLPPQPPALTGAAGDAEVRLAWTAPQDTGGAALTGYRLYRDGVLHRQLGLVDAYVDAEVENGRTYRYRVSALTPVGEGARSAERALTPMAPNAPPTACFTHHVVEGTLTVSGACSADPDGRIVAWTWRWGDASADAHGADAAHTYHAGGTFAVQLTVADDRGAKATTTVSVTIAGPTDPDPTVPTLAYAEWNPDALPAPGAWKVYKVWVPSGVGQLQVDQRSPAATCVLTVCDPDLDVYLRKGQAPTAQAYDCRAAENGRHEACLRPSPAPGWWYVGIHLETGDSATYEVRAVW